LMAAECANFEVTRMARLPRCPLGLLPLARDPDQAPLPSEERRANLEARSSASTERATAPTAPAHHARSPRRRRTGHQEHRRETHGGLRHRRGQPAGLQGHDRVGTGSIYPRTWCNVTSTPTSSTCLDERYHVLKIGVSDVYLCCVRDDAPRGSWVATGDSMHTEIVTDALAMAVRRRHNNVGGVIFTRTEQSVQ